ncbi:MAG: tandem-95 repeat protein, partial [bacterium]
GNPPQYPDIDVNSTLFSFTVQQNDTSSDLLVISNNGNSNLVWSVTEVVPAAWLTESPVSGTISPAGYQNVRLSVDATSLASGGYACDLSIASNDPDENPLIVSVNLTVTPGATNQLPVAVNDTAQVDEDHGILIDVLANDNDPDGTLDATSVMITSDVTHGSSSINPTTGVVSYTPDADYFGTDQFSYTVNDNQGGTSNVAQVSITINSVNDPPVLTGIPDVQFDEDDHYILPLNMYLNDVDHDTTEVQFSSLVSGAGSLSSRGGGLAILVDPTDLLVTINPVNHRATFSATSDSSGLFTVVFFAQDDSNAVDTDTISVTVSAQNDPPVISALPELMFDEDDTLEVLNSFWYPFVHDPDHPDDVLNYQITGGGAVSVNSGQGSYYLFAAPNWFGDDTLQLIVSDLVINDTSEFLVTVNSVNDPPVLSAYPDTIRFRVDSSATLQVWDFVEDVETPDPLLSYQFTAPPQTLLLVFNSASGQLRVSAEAGFIGFTTLQMEVSDDSSASVQANMVVEVEPILGTENPRNIQIPSHYFLGQNYPNPFNPLTTVEYGLKSSADVTLKIYNLLGQEVRTLIKANQEAGYHSVVWDGRDNYGQLAASGIYIYRLETRDFVSTRKMILMK